MDTRPMQNDPMPEEIVPPEIQQAAEDAVALASSVLADAEPAQAHAVPTGPQTPAQPAEAAAQSVPPADFAETAADSAGSDPAPVTPDAAHVQTAAEPVVSSGGDPAPVISDTAPAAEPAGSSGGVPVPAAPDAAPVQAAAEPSSDATENTAEPAAPAAAVQPEADGDFSQSAAADQPDAAPEQAAQDSPEGRIQFAAPLYTVAPQSDPVPGEPVPSPVKFFLFDLVLNLPLVGLILSIIWSFDEQGPLYRRNLSIGHILALLVRGIIKMAVLAALLASLNRFLASLPASSFPDSFFPFDFYSGSSQFRTDDPEDFFRYYFGDDLPEDAFGHHAPELQVPSAAE